MNASQVLRILLVGADQESLLPARLSTLGWPWEALSLDSWLAAPSLSVDAVVIDMSGSRSSDTWLRIHHLVPRVSYPLVLAVDAAVPSSFHYARAGLRVALLPTAPHPDLLRSTVSLARQNFQLVRLTGDGHETPESLDREALIASVRRVRQELESMEDLLEPGNGASRPGEALGDRELEVQGLLLKGISIAEIGERLGIAESTVKKHIHSIYKKRGVSNRAQLMAEGS